MQKSGFTLLELSIVMIIIGLIVGGITVGADMIRGMELKSVISDVNEYKTAVNTFRLKYNALPGDMRNANSYWSGIANGNGNGRVDVWATEAALTWRMMASAEMISGDANSSVNIIPSSSLTDGYFYIYYNDLYSVDASTYGQNGNAITLATPISGGPVLGRTLTPLDAEYIDSKSDDGNPNDGQTQGRRVSSSSAPYCYVSVGNYNIAEESKACRMMFWLD